MIKGLLWTLGAIAALVVVAFIVFKASPWPSALIIRHAFDADAWRVSKALESHLPQGVAQRLNERYAKRDRDAHLDVFYPAKLDTNGQALPTIVWVHGGGWVSGSKDQIANYLRILAARGFTTVGVDYSIAPRRTYPTPIRQVNAALGYLVKNAHRLHVDPAAFILAGDSGGAHIASQLANALSVPSYAKALGVTPAIRRSQLRGMLLYCGVYDVKDVRLDGPYGSFLKTMLWSYSGRGDFLTNPHFATASVIDYVTPAFPPVFISVGNDDPLESQSRAFAGTLGGLGVPVDSLFYAPDDEPALAHEYQFNLDWDAGRLALERSVQFIAARAPAYFPGGAPGIERTNSR